MAASENFFIGIVIGYSSKKIKAFRPKSNPDLCIYLLFIFTFRGLLLSEMNSTVKGMLENFLEMVDLLGYVPNGGRVYFRRSQPPFLIPMMKLYLDHTNDLDFIRRSLPLLEKEFDFWIQNRNVTVRHNGKNYPVIRYNVEYTGPRPESYR